MCGVLGVIENNKKIDKNLFERMTDEIRHRGPESEGLWFSEKGNVALGHRRLAIIDLSPGGHQPMVRDNGRFAITFNGEIYNYKELKKELEKLGETFRTESDTEVLLAAYLRWGEAFLEKLNGMFAFAIWDEKEQKLFAARDRLGEKPFKYYHDKNKFIFASEIKAILADPTVEKKIDHQAIDEALSFRFVSSPKTGFVGIKKLPAGHCLVWQNNLISIKEYWNCQGAVQQPSVSGDLKTEIWSLFLDSVKKRMVADVPVGAFLSGGVDSTSVIAAMQEVGVKNIETFVISIGGKSEDQKYAAQAAKYFGTNHHEIEIGNINYSEALKNIAHYYDEPFFDQSALPSMLISSEMKKYVTVVLSGDGGDELFGGYDAYKTIKYINTFSKLPYSIKQLVASMLLPLSSKVGYMAEISAKKSFFESYTEYYALWKTSLEKSRKYITKDDLYLPEFKNSINPNNSWQKMAEWFGVGSDLVNNAMMADIRGRLADGYLTKTDIATMSSAIELRPPFLDHRLVELSTRIPSSLKIRKNNEKWLWKEIVKNKIPKEIINRKKVGFGIPLHNIIKTELKDLVEGSILLPSSCISEFFSVDTIKNLWVDHNKNKADYSNHLWSLLMLELWLKKYLGK